MIKISTLKLALVGGTLLFPAITFAQIKFTSANSVLHSEAGTLGSNANIRSGNTVIVVDIDNNGLDDIAKLDNNRYLRIEYQQGGGTFTIANSVFDIGAGGVDIWGASMADVDHNGYKDYLYAGWGDGARLIKLNASGTGNLGITSLPDGNIASQNCNFMDVNNDGWEDIFVCNDVDESKIWINSGTGTFPAEQGNGPHINFDVTPGTSAPNDESGNYGSVWTDFDNDGDVDLFIAHCRQGQPAGDIRRTNVLFKNNGSNVFTSSASAHGLASNDQDWTSAFGDIDNDGDFDLLLTGHESTPDERLFINDGNGNFTPNTAQPTVSFNNSSWAQQAFMDDFDNDGWIDIIITGGAQQVIHRNNGNNTFTLVDNSTIGFGTGEILAFAAGDLNHDGRVDLYTGYGSIYNNPSSSTDDVLWLNDTDNDNNWLTLDLRGTMSTDGALGARAYIYGSWGVQTREVRASESYGTMNSFKLHFGLGTETNIDSVVIDWPASGSPNTVITDPNPNQFITIIEGNCVSPDNRITYTGSPVICSPGTLTLNAPTGAGYSYLWSTGATTPSINVGVGGNYNVRVTQSGNACVSWSPTIEVLVDPNETPTITVTGNTTFCPGGSVTLTSSESTGNTWSNSSTSSSINVTTAGSYTVDYAGACQTWTSAPVVVTLLAAPSAPVTTDDLIPVPGVGSLTSTGTNIEWYNAASGGSLVGTGSPFTTPFVSVNTTFYAQDVNEYGGLTANVGQVNHSGSAYNGLTYNGYLVFDVTENATLNTVKVYTDSAANRTIELRNSVGTVLQSSTQFIPAGTNVITLNFPLVPGTGYELGTNSAANEAINGSGNISPILRRSSSGVTYPYILSGGAVTITTSSASGNYYYFYDWNVTVDPTDVCASPRTPAIVNILTGIENQNDYNVLVYPNPADDYINVEFNTTEQVDALLTVFDMLGKKVYDVNVGTVNGSVIKTIHTATWAAGFYTVQLNIKNTTYTTKVIIK